MRPNDHAQRYVREARRLTVAMLKAEVDYPAKHESKKVLIGELRSEHCLIENIQNIEHIRIGDQGQFNEFPDLPASHQRPDLLVFLRYFVGSAKTCHAPS